jgi:TolB-like protein
LEPTAANSIVQQPDTLPALPDKPSIAVLAFENMSGDPEQEYFADGIAEDIITALSRFHWFFVIARNSSFSYKGTSPNIRDVARDLGVRYVLEGSVRKAASRVRVTAQLIEASTGHHVWADRYDRDLEDIFAVQDEITEAITAAVAPTFAAAEAQRAEHKAPESFDAWDYAIRGNWHFWRLSLEDNVEAKRLFEAAIALDPKSSLALCGLTLACVYDVVFFGDADDQPASLTRAIETAEQAISADEHDAWAHVALSYANTFNGRHDIAFSAIQRAVDLNPNLPFAEALLAQRYAWNGDYDAAHSHADTAARLSPRDPANVWWLFPRVIAAFVVEKYDEQVSWAKKATEAAPGFPGGWAHLAVGEAYLGHIENARAAMRQMLRVAPRATVKLYGTAIPARRPEDLERALEGLRKAGMPE